MRVINGIKVGGRNISNFRYADDTTLMAENKEELKSLLMRLKKQSEKASLKLNIKKTKIMASGPTTSWQWHATPVLLPGKSHGWRSLVGCSPWGR